MKVPFDADYIQEGAVLGIKVDAITREGHRVRIVEFEGDLYGDGPDFPLLGYDLDAKDPSTVRSWKKDGTYFRDGFEHARDLLYMNLC